MNVHVHTARYTMGRRDSGTPDNPHMSLRAESMSYTIQMCCRIGFLLAVSLLRRVLPDYMVSLSTRDVVKQGVCASLLQGKGFCVLLLCHCCVRRRVQSKVDDGSSSWSRQSSACKLISGG